MGTCWKCGKDVFLKEEDTHCDSCKNIVRYVCNTCHKSFDVVDKATKEKLKECKWCNFFVCPNCSACSLDCSKYIHANKVKAILNGIIPIDKYDQLNNKAIAIVAYFEEIKMSHKRTMCEFGVPKTYAKQRIKEIVCKMKGYRVRDENDMKAFEQKQEEVLDKNIGYEFTIGNTRDNGSYGQEYRDVFNFCVCMGKLKYQRKTFTTEKGIEITYDSWLRIEEGRCPFLDVDEVIVKRCPNCQKIYSRNEIYCLDCLYKRGGKKHEKGSHYELIEKQSDNPTCRALDKFKQKEEDFEEESDEDGES